MLRLNFGSEQINRDPISNEMIKMRQQLEYLQAELCARGGGASSDEVQVFKLWLLYCVAFSAQSDH